MCIRDSINAEYGITKSKTAKMSDMDDFMYDEDAGDFDFEDGDEGDFGDFEDFDGDEEEDDPKIAVENQYYQSKDLEEEEGIDAAIKGFEKVMEMEKNLDGNNGEYSFKALKKIIKLHFKQNNKAELQKRYEEILGYNSAKNSISEQDLFKGITRILDTIAAQSTDTDLVLQMYDIALERMKKKKNENLWFKTSLKLASRMFDKRAFDKLKPILTELEKACLGKDGKEDPKKANQLLEVLALSIQMNMDMKNKLKTKQIHDEAFEVFKRNPGILNSKLAIFHYVAGKLQMENMDFQRAYGSFFESFNFFEEGSSRFKVPCLKYIVLSNMLMGSDIDPFNSPDTANLKNHKEVSPMAELLDAFQHKEIQRFEKILKKNKKIIEGDKFIAQFMPLVLREIRTNVLLQMIKPYTRVTLPFLASKLNIPVDDVQELLVFLILDTKIEGRIDQVNQLLTLDKGGATIKYRYMEKWTNQLGSLHNVVLSKMN
eukprot:TRINITY_DN2608_c0_g3_i1.p1 TRINITY_DN2608_c0_g3~~TRINITY_DN2608_c0_g3_i1.p1  ORF type:complete len:486 (+),score=108.60 TRINITY_DN2608_c0_g3_i1:46-1503(+)